MGAGAGKPALTIRRQNNENECVSDRVPAILLVEKSVCPRNMDLIPELGNQSLFNAISVPR